MKAYRTLFDKVLTRTDPERAHQQAFAAIRAAGPALAKARTPGSPVHAMGLTFPNVIGLAAGFDKNAVGIDALGGLGFGHVEIGTVTGEGQPGNPAPRLFRLPADRAVINRMGFNNDGAEAVAARLASRLERRGGAVPDGPVLGINIGKTKVVPEDDQAAVEADYAKSARLLAPYADYLVVNVSSPNTPGLRTLQSVEKLQPLLEHVRSIADQVTKHRVPLLVKIAPDLADSDVVEVADLAMAIGLDGIIATNTTIGREGLASSPKEITAAGAGGLSGAPLKTRALDVLRLLRSRVSPETTLVGVGGISTVEDARERLAAGADLLQGYTGFIYEGPLYARRIASGVGAR
ncbi:dihydroorotate dehydrogenase [Nocardioides luteus]|uniref:Dihydroorotate dehydrogenase (quinone) n=1 Tax=Nocardioides luteus TaxID=1844 RepID=A0ABQ5T0W9_9ACTN|nr:quinone-dependent dihydroorotate dehydrogenase [Nocardioides luteus]MDR7310843.1 dihydroorotate dehydrogenase [Nocardioides luteus]GGR40268.1 dihydroorotate dehydrogenase (quinone) [Nocardioides luteus]GLJ69377.1 dihydroorotate dehydrogenase (quinone) [Nocardioides luteus]